MIRYSTLRVLQGEQVEKVVKSVKSSIEHDRRNRDMIIPILSSSKLPSPFTSSSISKRIKASVSLPSSPLFQSTNAHVKSEFSKQSPMITMSTISSANSVTSPQPTSSQSYASTSKTMYAGLHSSMEVEPISISYKSSSLSSSVPNLSPILSEPSNNTTSSSSVASSLKFQDAYVLTQPSQKNTEIPANSSN